MFFCPKCDVKINGYLDMEHYLIIQKNIIRIIKSMGGMRNRQFSSREIRTMYNNDHKLPINHHIMACIMREITKKGIILQKSNRRYKLPPRSYK